tara:strand:- start:2135 stop:2716 length:582 start_codon:yes stop_codon:yes gene_type:complete
MSYENFINNTLHNKYFEIINIKNDGSCCYKSILTCLKNINYNISSNLNSKVIQSKSLKWIINNKNKYLENFYSTVEDLVLDTHDVIDFEQYVDRYKVYSGKEYNNIENDRWGGLPEIIALSNIYKLNINVYCIQSFDKKKNKIIKGKITNNKLNKSSRFKLLYSTSRNEYNKDINLLFTNINNIEHFDSLVKK